MKVITIVPNNDTQVHGNDCSNFHCCRTCVQQFQSVSAHVECVHGSEKPLSLRREKRSVKGRQSKDGLGKAICLFESDITNLVIADVVFQHLLMQLVSDFIFGFVYRRPHNSVKI
jgi:hypothetical protein